jgi:hypothetical protein
MNREVSIPAKCQKHPGYKVKRQPTGDCDMCWKLWREGWESRMPIVPAPHIHEHPEYGELIEKWLGGKRV